jgi:hypothetical protein
MWRGLSKPLVIVLTSAAIALAAFYIIHRLVDPLPPKTEPAVTFNHLRFPIARSRHAVIGCVSRHLVGLDLLSYPD